MKKDELLNEQIIIENEEQFNDFLILKDNVGVDKLLELCDNYKSVLFNVKNIRFVDLQNFIIYEHTLSSILFTLLRTGEDSVKAFLSNTFSGTKLDIETRPSNFTKTKYYFLFPSTGNEPLRIRTHNYTSGPVSYYDAIRELDFGDVNLIFSHLPKRIQKQYSDDDSIVEILDMTRKVRNYVYHHNLLFSLGKGMLQNAINQLVSFISYQDLKDGFVNSFNEAAKNCGLDEKFHIIIY